MEKVIQSWLGGVLSHFNDEEAELFISKYEKLARVLAQHAGQPQDVDLMHIDSDVNSKK